MRILISFFLLSLNILPLFAQQVPVFEWRDHLTYSKVSKVAYSNNRVYAASTSGMFFVDMDDNTINRLGTINGLSDVVATGINSNITKDAVYIGYENGTIDIIEGNDLYNIFDIERSSLIGNKQVNHFNFYNESRCFVSTGFGIVEFNTTNKEISETYLIGNNGDQVFVNSTFVSGDTLFAATQNGLYKGSLKTFLYNPLNWKKVTEFPEADSNLSAGFEFAGKIHVNSKHQSFASDSLYTLQDTGWALNQTLSNESNNSFEIKNGQLLVANSTSFEVWDTTWNNVRREFQANDKPIIPLYAVFGSEQDIWFGDFFLGLILNKGPFANIEYLIKGPSSKKAFRLNSMGGTVYVSGGGHSDLNIRLGFSLEISKFRDENWVFFNQHTNQGFDTITDVISLAQNPKNPDEFAAASMGGGCLLFKNDILDTKYDSSNSELTALAENVTYVTGVDYDKNGLLWIANSISRQPVHAVNASGDWFSFSLGDQSSLRKTNQIMTTDWGHIWYIIPGIGLGVLDYNNTLTTNDDDRYLELSTAAGSGALPSNEVTRIANDFDGHIWVGTNAGLHVFYNASNLLDRSDKDSKEVYINQDGQTQVLFKDQFITDIFTDAANRKWVSTRGNGVYLMSPDGSQEVRHFTTQNSPLFSDEVTSVVVDEKSGEVFFGTEKGIISFRETATASSNFSSIHAFPNPVAPGYTGVIAIKGIADKATVIITDIAGNKVFETTSDGGQATWNGQNLNGERVSTGIYLIYGVSEDGTNKGVAKVLIEN